MARTANTQLQIAKLKKQLEALQKKEQAVISKKQEKALAQIVKIIKDNAIDMSDVKKALGEGTKTKSGTKAAKATSKKSSLKGKPVAAKYQNPANHAETWTGRGISPKWIQALKAEGKLESALIKHTEPQA